MKILILQPSLMTGGVEKSLINFLKRIDYSNHEVDLYLSQVTGDFLQMIPKDVNVLFKDRLAEPQFTVSGIKQKIKSIVGKVVNMLPFLIRLKFKKRFKKFKIEKHYDMAIAYHGLFNDLLFLLTDKISAEKKYAICHGDVSMAKINKKYTLEQFGKLDKVFFVSKSCEVRFNNFFKRNKVNTGCSYNLQDINEIQKRSDETNVNLGNGINIISVSRLSEEKAHIRTLEIMKRLKDKGFDFTWHILGDGEERSKIEKYIATNDMQTFVKLYGNKQNPYPYIKAADLLFLGSYHESFGLVLVEAMALGVPVLTTRTCSAEEVVGKYGFICENTKDGIFNTLCQILTDNKLLKEKKELLRNYSLDKELIADEFKGVLKFDE